MTHLSDRERESLRTLVTASTNYLVAKTEALQKRGEGGLPANPISQAVAERIANAEYQTQTLGDGVEVNGTYYSADQCNNPPEPDPEYVTAYVPTELDRMMRLLSEHGDWFAKTRVLGVPLFHVANLYVAANTPAADTDPDT